MCPSRTSASVTVCSWPPAEPPAGESGGRAPGAPSSPRVPETLSFPSPNGGHPGLPEARVRVLRVYPETPPARAGRGREATLLPPCVWDMGAPHLRNDWGTEAPAPPSSPGSCGGSGAPENLKGGEASGHEAAQRAVQAAAGSPRTPRRAPWSAGRLRPRRRCGPGAHAAPRCSLPPCSVSQRHRRLSFC